MQFVQNFPFFSILLCMFSGIVSSVLSPKRAKALTLFATAAVCVMSFFVWRYTVRTDSAYAFMMGHFPAPWGNEIRAGRLETVLAMVFSGIMNLSVLSGTFDLDKHCARPKQNLYYIMVDLAQAALLVMLYTNDIFTAYVFIEINTIAACALIMVRQNGHTLVAATKYLIMNLLASGMVLLGLTMLYGITGHLLMPQLQEAITRISASGEYAAPLTTVILLLTVGLGIKSALFPFHGWAPAAYSSAPPASAAILSGLVSKGYIFLLIKIYYRVFTLEVVRGHHVVDMLFLFGIIAMILASMMAIRQADIYKMIAYSSVAQIGYLFMGIGMGTDAGLAAALLHMVTHAAAKPVLFISSAALAEASGLHRRFHYLHGAAYRCWAAGLAFTVAAMSMVGIPLTSGFISKIRLALAATELSNGYAWTALLAIALSTLLNTVYFLQTVVSIYRKPEADLEPLPAKPDPLGQDNRIGLLALSAVTLAVGVVSGPLMQSIVRGLAAFA